MTEAPPTPSPQSLARTIEWHRGGRLAEAENGYREWLAAHPADPDVLRMLGVLRFQRGDAREARELLERAIALRDDQADGFVNLGLVLKHLDEPAAAIDAYRRALDLAPHEPAAWLGLSDACRRAGRPDEALDAAGRALALAPGQPDVLVARGAALRASGRLDEAIAAYREVLAGAPERVDAWHNLGNALAESGAHESAVEAFVEALARDPGDRDSLAGLVAMEEKIELPGDIDALFERLAAGASDARLFLLWGRSLRQRGRLDEAEQRYRRALARDERNAECLNDYGLLLTGRGEHAAAAECYRRALEIGGERPEWLFNLGGARLKLGEIEAAIALYRRVLALRPDFGEASFNLGMLYYSLERIDEASDVFVAWHRLAPDDPVAAHLASAATGGRLERCADDYVRREFDHFAGDYDDILRGLNYRGPQLIGDGLPREMRVANGSLEVLDAGCGTGLCASLLRPLARHLVGIDLSAGMLARARALGLYDELVEAELGAWLAIREACFDLIVSADTLNYFGRLDGVLGAMRKALRAGGALVFTLERAPAGFDEDYRLNPNGRFVHAERYVLDVLAESGFEVVECQRDVIREERGRAVSAHRISARRGGKSS